MVKYIGEEKAKQFADAHEYTEKANLSDIEKRDIEMDLYNNAKGREIAMKLNWWNRKWYKNKDYAKDVFEAVSNGEMKIFNKNKTGLISSNREGAK